MKLIELLNAWRGIRWVQRMVSPHPSPSRDAVQYADYILNHYSRNSHADKLCLARDLERHGWRKKRANRLGSGDGERMTL